MHCLTLCRSPRKRVPPAPAVKPSDILSAKKQPPALARSAAPGGAMSAVLRRRQRQTIVVQPAELTDAHRQVSSVDSTINCHVKLYLVHGIHTRSLSPYTETVVFAL